MKAVIFDMDGVIVDSEPIWIASKQQMLREQGIEVP
ncbi:MAG: HAD family phosphatase, partial [Enterococcus sp.]|nr:HAD family phosphatase [Enterococcus sp.]